MKETIYNMLKKIKKMGIKKLIIIISIIVVIFSILVITYRYAEDKKFKEEISTNNYTSMDDFKSVKEVVLYMGCDYIKEETIKNSDYEKVIYLKFKYNLYNDDNTSNKKFFDNLSIYIAKVLGYSNFKMIDESKNITIEIICSKDEEIVTKMIVNGNENYFEEENTKIQIEKYEEKEENKNMVIDSNTLKTLINNEWVETKVNFGTKESSFEDYSIYFDEGLEVKTIGKKVFNIIFTQNYSESIVNNIKVGESFENIEKVLGDPNFKQEDIIGYKNEEIYIFFEKEEVSIYRVDNSNSEDFIKLINSLDELKSVGKIANELTEIWEDFDEYYVSGNQVNIVYSLKGVKLQFNMGNQHGFILYNNYKGNISTEKGIKDISELNLPSNVYVNTEEDLVFIKETSRKVNNDEREYYCSMQVEDDNENSLNSLSEQFKYYIYVNENGVKSVKFLCKDNKYPKYELEADINSYMWLDDYRFLYSIKNSGIYMLDLRDRKTTTVIEKSGQEYAFKEYNENKLKYDEYEINIK